jgi:hypothetical protein
METIIGTSLHNYLYLKLAFLIITYVFSSTKLENKRVKMTVFIDSYFLEAVAFDMIVRLIKRGSRGREERKGGEERRENRRKRGKGEKERSILHSFSYFSVVLLTFYDTSIGDSSVYIIPPAYTHDFVHTQIYVYMHYVDHSYKSRLSTSMLSS